MAEVETGLQPQWPIGPSHYVFLWNRTENITLFPRTSLCSCPNASPAPTISPTSVCFLPNTCYAVLVKCHLQIQANEGSTISFVNCYERLMLGGIYIVTEKQGDEDGLIVDYLGHCPLSSTDVQRCCFQDHQPTNLFFHQPSRKWLSMEIMIPSRVYDKNSDSFVTKRVFETPPPPMIHQVHFHEFSTFRATCPCDFCR